MDEQDKQALESLKSEYDKGIVEIKVAQELFKKQQKEIDELQSLKITFGVLAVVREGSSIGSYDARRDNVVPWSGRLSAGGYELFACLAYLGE